MQRFMFRSMPVAAVLAAFLIAGMFNAEPTEVQAAVQGGQQTLVAASFEQLTISTSAVSLSSTTLRPTPGSVEVVYCSGVLEDAPVRYRYDGGGAPTTTVGHLLAAGDAFEISGADNVRNLQLIRTGGTDGVLPLTCHR